jgi:hypothetical protein
MATNNAINLKSSGIVSYDGAGAFSALANPLTVANGGTGDATLTAYAALCGGTTSTGVIQSIASVGTTGQLLTSNGAAALPTFQTLSTTGTGKLIFFNKTASGNPADSQTYFLTFGINTSFTGITASGNAATRFYIPIAGTITKCYGNIGVAGTLGSAQNCTVAIRLNNTTDTNVTTTLQLTAVSNLFNNTALSIAVVAGDYIEVKFTGPAWTTNPTTVRAAISILIT